MTEAESKVSLGDTAEFSICPATDAVKGTVPSSLSAALKESAQAEPPVESGGKLQEMAMSSINTQAAVGICFHQSCPALGTDEI